MKIYFLTTVFALLCSVSFVSAQNYTVSQSEIFNPQKKKVDLRIRVWAFFDAEHG